MNQKPRAPAFHRRLSTHNENEFDLVAKSMEVCGRGAKTSYWGVCVQAWVGHHGDRTSAYSFGTWVVPNLKFGFVDGLPVPREAVWEVGMDGVVERENGQLACIGIFWLEKEQGVG